MASRILQLAARFLQPRTPFRVIASRLKSTASTPYDQYVLEADQRRQWRERAIKKASYIVLGPAAIGVIWFCLEYGTAPRDELGETVTDEFSGSAFAPFHRIKKGFRAWRDFFAEPSREVLLPDPIPDPYHQPKYTLVIEMKNVLVNPEWSYTEGHRFKMRPALEYFLDLVGYPNFEVVLYTSEKNVVAEVVAEIIDPKQRIMHRLYRDCTNYTNGHHVKDLSKLNRDLSKIIYIDFDPQSSQLNPENVLRVPKWDGDMEDTALVDLAELLKTIHMSDVDDVRPVLQYYSQLDDPAKEFRKRAISFAQKEAKRKDAPSDQGRGVQSRSYTSWLTGRKYEKL